MAKKIATDLEKEQELITYLHSLVQRAIKTEKAYKKDMPENYMSITQNALKAAAELTKIYGYGKDLEDALDLKGNITINFD